MRARLPFPRAPLALIAITACGGAPTEVKDAHPAGPDDISIGDTALAQGGIGGLGGAGSGMSDTAPGTLRASLVDKTNPVKLDGVLGEWPGRTAARTEVKGTAGGAVSFAVAVQYDERLLYVGGEVTQDSFTRTPRFGDGEDHASLILAFPSGSSASAYEIGLFAGTPGESAGEVRFLGSRHGVISGAKIVEAPSGRGYTFEATIPWSTFPEARLLRVGLRGVARYYASDGSATPHTILATGAGDTARPSGLPPLLTEAEQSIVDGILTERGLASQAPKVDLFVDVAGDAMKERVSVWGGILTICGPGYRGGKEYFYRDLGGELVRLDARDVTGRGKDDLVIRRRLSVDGASRDWFEVLSVLKGDEPTATFGHEIAVARDGKRLSNAVHVGAKQIDVSLEPASGWDVSSYREAPIDGALPILLPWGPTRAETFRFDGSRFVKVHEDRQTPAPGAAPPPSSRPPPMLPPRSAEPATPPVVATSALKGNVSAQVFAQYRRDQGLPPDARPKVDLTVDVDGDGTPERVVLIGRDIVVLGPGFKGGAQYAFLTLSQFDAPADVQDMSARDLTGDGAADLVVRGTRHLSAAAGGGGGMPLDLDALFVYQVKAGAITRVFAIETGRGQRGRRAQGLVQFVPGRDGRGFEVDVRPGRVTGWTQKSYPWSQDQPGSGVLEPLLLPWGGIASLRYGWNGSAFVRQSAQ